MDAGTPVARSVLRRPDGSATFGLVIGEPLYELTHQLPGGVLPAAHGLAFRQVEILLDYVGAERVQKLGRGATTST